MSAYTCERCWNPVPTFDDLVWVQRQPDDDAATWPVCDRCEERATCGLCEGHGCVWCGRRAARAARALGRREERARRKRLLENGDWWRGSDALIRRSVEDRYRDWLSREGIRPPPKLPHPSRMRHILALDVIIHARRAP